MMNRVKPCPFCNCKAVEISPSKGGWTHFTCNECAANVIGDNFEDAKEKWNTRFPKEVKDEG